MSDSGPNIEGISAITLATHDMARAVDFYQRLGFTVRKGGAGRDFTTLNAGNGTLNLIAAGDDTQWHWWGRVIFYTQDVDGMYQRALDAGLTPEFSPEDARWGERYFHITDPDGHELSFAWPLSGDKQGLWLC